MTELTQTPVTWWLPVPFEPRIMQVTVWKETEHCLYTGPVAPGSRNCKASTYGTYYRTYAEARTALIQREGDKCELRERQLWEARAALSAAFLLDESREEVAHALPE